MSTWYAKQLGNGGHAFTPTSEIQEAFLKVYAATGMPSDMAVFSHYDIETNMVTAYFSPGASILAKMFGAEECAKPSRSDIGLLVGDDSARAMFSSVSQGYQ